MRLNNTVLSVLCVCSSCDTSFNIKCFVFVIVAIDVVDVVVVVVFYFVKLYTVFVSSVVCESVLCVVRHYRLYTISCIRT